MATEEKDIQYWYDDLNSKIYRSNKTKNNVIRILRLYTVIGMLIFVLGIIYFTLSLFELRITQSQRIVLIISGSGIIIAILSKFYIDYFKEKEKQELDKKQELEKISSFLMNWINFERTTNKLVEIKKWNDNKFSISRNLEELFLRNVISNRDYLNLEKALDLRNQIVHGKFELTDLNELDKVSESLEVITEKVVDSI